MPAASEAGAKVSRARTLLVGANDVLLDGIADWLAQEPHFEIVGRAHTGSRALDEIETLRAELVLMDVTLPDMSGFEVARRIKAPAEAPLVVLLSFHDSQAARLEARAAGADGFVVKSGITECLTPLVGDLLRRRDLGVRERSSVVPFKRVPSTDCVK